MPSSRPTGTETVLTSVKVYFSISFYFVTFRITFLCLVLKFHRVLYLILYIFIYTYIYIFIYVYIELYDHVLLCTFIIFHNHFRCAYPSKTANDLHLKREQNDQFNLSFS